MNYIQIGARTFVEPSAVTHLESEINYTIVHLQNGRCQTLSYTLGKIHAFLPAGFIRINRSCVVNANFIKRRKHNKIWLKGGGSFVISRRRYDEVDHRIKSFSMAN